MEDYCRFYLNNPAFSSRCKQLRHELSGAISKLDEGKLLACRDTIADVGTAIKVAGQLSRHSLQESATAAAKRLSEALRTISETAAPGFPEVAASVEKTRYQSYTLERDIFLASNAYEKFKNVKLYVIITSEFPAEILTQVQACILGGADCIQLRAKNLNADELYECGSEIARLCRENNVLSIVNDRVDIALACGADGVHLGQHDMPIEKARAVGTRPVIIGGSTHNVTELRRCIEQGVDYVGVGPCFGSLTKPDLAVAGLGYVREAVKIASNAGLLTVAIGGITDQNISKVLETGIHAVAVSAAVLKCQDPQAMCKKLKRLIVSSQTA
jgi:thiamine-phosphate pyrophosphorylase